MRRASILLTLGLGLGCTPLLAPAIGFGRTGNASGLGQRLDFVAGVTLDGDEAIVRECVFAEVNQGDARVPADKVRVVVEPGTDANGERRIRVRTTSPIDEPVVTVSLTIGCKSKVARKFVTFIDPPSLTLAQAEPPSEPAERESQVAPLVAGVRADSATTTSAGDGTRGHAAARQRRRVAAGRPVGTTMASSRNLGAEVAAADAKRPGEPATPIVAARKATPGSRLQLEAPVAVARPSASSSSVDPTVSVLAAVTRALAPRGAASTSPTPSPVAIVPEPVAVADADPAAASLARQGAQIRELEAGLASLRQESQRNQQTVVALQARLHQAETQRYANPLVFVLSGLVLLMSGVIAALWWLPRRRGDARWFDGAGAAIPATAARSQAAHADIDLVLEQHAGLPPASASIAPASMPAPLARPSPAETSISAIGGLDVITMPESEFLNREMAMSGSVEPALAALTDPTQRQREPSMEELIDLEQQVEFFVVLGQDEAAIDLLDTHIGQGAGSPLPYLKLLEIHQRRKDRTAYERVQAAFNARFKAYAPDWSSDLHFGRSLEEYPQIVVGLQGAWKEPMRTMQMLDGMLFRRHESDDAFDFPAYRELLFLYSIARDLSGDVMPAGDDVDLLLPLDGASLALLSKGRTSKPAVVTPITRDSMYAVDLDISQWAEETSPDVTGRHAPAVRAAGGWH